MRKLTCIVWVALVPRVLGDPSAACYYPSGNYALGFYPCDQYAYITMCCPQGYTCMSNQLCVVTTPSTSYPNLTLGTAMRGACTDPMWQNGVCGSQCLDNANQNGALTACGGDRFCCSADYDAGKCDCSSNGNAFVAGSARAETIIGVTGTFTGTPSYLVTVSTSAPTRSASLSTTSSRTSSRFTTTSRSAPQTTLSSSQTSRSTVPTTTIASSSVSSAASAIASATASGNSTASSDGNGHGSVGVKAGLGVGIPVAVAAVAGLSWFLYSRRRRHQTPVGSPVAHQGEQMEEAGIGAYPHYPDPHSDPYTVPNVPQRYQQMSPPPAEYTGESRTNVNPVPPVDNPYDRREAGHGGQGWGEGWGQR